MGAFISMSGIIGKSQDEVLKALNSYYEDKHKKLKETALNTELYNLFLLYEDKNNCVILYPENFFEFEDIAINLTKELKVPMFNFNIYNIDLWMYDMYYDGKLIDKFNPMQKYLEDEENIETQTFKGNPKIVCQYLKNVKVKDIKEYYKLWTDKLIKSKKKAYPNDEFSYGVNWQAIDFMKKLNLNYPIIDEEEIIGRAFKLI